MREELLGNCNRLHLSGFCGGKLAKQMIQVAVAALARLKLFEDAEVTLSTRHSAFQRPVNPTDFLGHCGFQYSIPNWKHALMQRTLPLSRSPPGCTLAEVVHDALVRDFIGTLQQLKIWRQYLQHWPELLQSFA